MLRITATVVATALLALAPGARAEDGPLTEFPLPTGASNPTAIAVGPDGALWFTESSNNKIGRITTAGAISEFPLPTANAQPNGIIAGADGNLWFTETNTNKIGRITPTGALTEFAIPTAASQPMGITLGGDGNVWFTEYGASKIGRITAAGVITESSTLFANDGPLYITPSPGNLGQVWYSGGIGNHVGYQSLSGGVAGQTTLPPPTGSPGGTPASTPTGIVAGADGAYHAIATAKSGGAGSPIPTLVRLPQFFGTFTDVASTSSTGSQLAADPAGGFWFVAYNGQLVRQMGDGVYTDLVQLTGGAHETCYSPSNARACPLNGVVLGPDKAVWFTDHANNAIGRFPSSYVPAPPPVAGPPGPAGVAGPAGPTGPAAPPVAGPPGPAGPAGGFVLVAFQTRVTAKRVTVKYALTGPARVALTVRPRKGKALRVTTATGKLGVNTISWNRKLGKKAAKAGTYKLQLDATVGGRQSTTSISVRLR